MSLDVLENRWKRFLILLVDNSSGAISWQINSVHLLQDLFNFLLSFKIRNRDNPYSGLLQELNMGLGNVRDLFTLHIFIIRLWFHVPSDWFCQHTVDWSSVVWDFYDMVLPIKIYIRVHQFDDSVFEILVVIFLYMTFLYFFDLFLQKFFCKSLWLFFWNNFFDFINSGIHRWIGMIMGIDEEIILHEENSFLIWSCVVKFENVATFLLLHWANVGSIDYHWILFKAK